MRKLKSIWLILVSKAYFYISDRGGGSELPLELATIEEIQIEVQRFDRWLEEVKNELILEGRKSS